MRALFRSEVELAASKAGDAFSGLGEALVWKGIVAAVEKRGLYLERVIEERARSAKHDDECQMRAAMYRLDECRTILGYITVELEHEIQRLKVAAKLAKEPENGGGGARDESVGPNAEAGADPGKPVGSSGGASVGGMAKQPDPLAGSRRGVSQMPFVRGALE